MNSPIPKRLAALESAGDALIANGLKGVEKESLRIDAEGMLALTPHPPGLGSALTNQYITTDFSESLLEFVTPAYHTTWEALRAICDVHQFTYEQLDDELLWVTSMPCGIPEDDDIPLARYGTSNVGCMKTAYRRGLGHRYGRRMQTIAGVHFNYSLPAPFWPAYRELLGDTRGEDEFRSEHYMGLVRNFRRHGWLLLYLFGASPALCKSFGSGDELQLESLNDNSWYAPFATSLRMSDLGYNNQNQSRINIGLNSLDEYIRDLSAAIRTPEPAYEPIGVKVDGVYRQLNANQLQIENEYYSPIRPKRVAHSGERPTAALRRGGVEYVEIRSLDINPFDPSGINQNTMRTIETFLLYCLLSDSPPLDNASLEETRHNQLLAARRGRDPALELRHDGASRILRDWAREILEECSAIAEYIDQEDRGTSYAASIAAALSVVDDPDLSPSARIIGDLEQTGQGFFDFALGLAYAHRDYFGSMEPLPPARQRELDGEAKDSLDRQRKIEESDAISFDEYLERYFAAD